MADSFASTGSNLIDPIHCIDAVNTTLQAYSTPPYPGHQIIGYIKLPVTYADADILRVDRLVLTCGVKQFSIVYPVFEINLYHRDGLVSWYSETGQLDDQVYYSASSNFDSTRRYIGIRWSYEFNTPEKLRMVINAPVNELVTKPPEIKYRLFKISY